MPNAPIKAPLNRMITSNIFFIMTLSSSARFYVLAIATHVLHYFYLFEMWKVSNYLLVKISVFGISIQSGVETYFIGVLVLNRNKEEYASFKTLIEVAKKIPDDISTFCGLSIKTIQIP